MRAVLLLLIAILPLRAEWIRMRVPGIELLTDAGERAGRQTLERLEALRSVFPPRAAGGDLHVTLFASEREFRQYSPKDAADGIYQKRPDGDAILLYAGGDVSRAAAHEYVHFLLSEGPAELPLWFEEGTAEFYSTMEAAGGRLRIGAEVPGHRETLARRQWMTAAELAAVTRRSAAYNERDRASVFYAESWALVRLLNLDPAYRAGMPRFAELLGTPLQGGQDAFVQAFGRTIEQALQDARGLSARAVTVEGPSQEKLEIGTEKLDDVEALLVQVSLALQGGHPETAKAVLAVASKGQGGPEIEAGYGMLARDQGDEEEAHARLLRAVEAGSRDAATWFELAMVEREAGADWTQVAARLRQVIVLDRDFAEAQFLLGVRATDDGKLDEAVADLREAVRAAPRRSSFWYALAFALERSGDLKGAGEAAGRALRTAETAEEEGMAQALRASIHDALE